MHLEFLQLKETLQDRCKDRSVLYLANIGNWGDALIRHGTLKLLKESGIRFKEISPAHSTTRLYFARRSVLIYGGSGAWCQFWRVAERHVRRYAGRADIIVLPSTFDQTFDLKGVTWYCRDKYESQEYMPLATFCHDMAFYLGRMECPDGTGTGLFFRTDKERKGSFPIPEGSIDLSVHGNHLSPVYPFFAEIAKYREIRTDRLHVAIGACLLGKKVQLFANGYFKNRSIYKSSLEGYFDDVEFIDADDA